MSSNHRRAAKRDANEPEIVDALEKAGGAVSRVNGTGIADLLVSFRNTWFVLEVKGEKEGLTEAQSEWHLRQRAHVAIVRSPREALEAIGVFSDFH